MKKYKLKLKLHVALTYDYLLILTITRKLQKFLICNFFEMLLNKDNHSEYLKFLRLLLVYCSHLEL